MKKYFLARFFIRPHFLLFFRFRFVHFLLMLVVFFCYDPTTLADTIHCEKVEDFNWELIGLHRTCFIEEFQYADFKKQISENKSDEISGLSLKNSHKLIKLPEKINKNFPNLEGYNADGCLIKKLNKNNFVGLTKLRNLQLNFNPLEEIPDNVFQDLQNLEFLHLSKYLINISFI